MSKLLFAWLGSGRSKRAHVGSLGRHLDQTARAGLPVPPGAVLLDELYRFCVDNDLAVSSAGRVLCPDPESLHATIFESLRLPAFDRPILIQPIGAETAMAGPVTEADCAELDSRDARQLGWALSAAWTSLERAGAERRDVLLLETIPATHSGTAVSRQADEYDHVSITEGPAQRTRQHNPSSSLLKLRGWRLPDDSLPPHLRRLQMLLRGIRRTMNPGEWMVRWADDGTICWLIELRELAGGPE